MQVKVKLDMAQFKSKMGALEGRFQSQAALMRQIAGDLREAYEMDNLGRVEVSIHAPTRGATNTATSELR